MQVDIGFGDLIVPRPIEIEYPTLLEFPPPVLMAYLASDAGPGSLSAQTHPSCRANNPWQTRRREQSVSRRPPSHFHPGAGDERHSCGFPLQSSKRQSRPNANRPLQ